MSTRAYVRRAMVVMAALLPVALIVLAQAPETKPAADPPPPGASESKPQAETDTPPKPVDRYAVPDGGADELLTFINELQRYRPRNYQDYLQHRTKAGEAIGAAAKKILELKPAEDSPAFRTATLVILRQRIGTVGEANKKQRKEIIQEVRDRLATKDKDTLGSEDFRLVMQLARGLEYADQRKLAAEIYREFGEQLAGSSNEQIAGMGRMLQGSARRVDLVGKEMEIEGTTMEGEPFDWQSYRGKVVLVDFWATWCGPCVAEVPNVKKNYELYHDQGFDVVGISLDRDREALEKFLAREKIAWVTLHEKQTQQNPNAEYYGIMSIPTVVLVDREGKVVSLRARGPELGVLLEKLIGPPSKQLPETEALEPTGDKEAKKT